MIDRKPPYVSIEGKTASEAYNKLFLRVYDKGISSSKESYAYQTGEDQLFREVESNLFIQDALREHMISWAMPGISNFPAYVGDVLLGTKDYLVKDGIYSYTYHERLFKSEREVLATTPNDLLKSGQITPLIDRLRKHPFSNRAQAVTWRVPKDNLDESGQPCLQRLWFKVYGDILVEHADWRSRDLFFAYDENLMGMLAIGKLVIDCLNDYSNLGLRRLSYVDRCDSLHVYGKDAKQFDGNVKELRKKITLLDLIVELSKIPNLKEEKIEVIKPLDILPPIPDISNTIVEEAKAFAHGDRSYQDLSKLFRISESSSSERMLRIWKGNRLFDAVDKAKREYFDKIFKV